MIRFAALAVLFAAAPLFAQTKEIVEELDTLLAQQRIAARHTEERNEDIEVLRRLLNKAFGFDHATSQLPEPPQPYHFININTVRPPDGFPAFDPEWGPVRPLVSSSLAAIPIGNRVSQSVGPFDGAYLKGSGVVFTLRVPKEAVINSNSPVCVGDIEGNLGLGNSCGKCHEGATAVHKSDTKADCASCHTAGTVTASAPLSDWDRVRAAVRGEKPPTVPASVTDPKKPRAAMCKPGDVRELIVAQLHAHAKHLRHLEKTDRITVVVTFDEVPGTTASRIPAPTDKPGFTSEELQAITLGDLHLKQSKYAEAAAAYEKGLVRHRDAVIRLTLPQTMTHEQATKVIAETQAKVRGLFKSLATAYLHQNDVDKARAALDLATTLKVELATAGVEKAKPRLPAKLVLTVAKSDIDRNPKRDELRKCAQFELSGFPPQPAEKK